MSKFKIGLIVLYFGKLPSYFDIFKLSIKFNPKIDILFYTDQVITNYPRNLIVRNCSFEDIRCRIQQKFDFKIALDKPYKLCDYRPAYGYIFEDELKNYDFWGHCDIDMVFGDLLKFLSDEILNSYDKIYQLGHLCLYRNTVENNRRFMSEGGMDYKSVFTTNINCVFDEGPGIQNKFNILKIPTYLASDCADIAPWYNRFFRVDYSKDYKDGFNYRHQVFYWENGRIMRASIVNGKIKCDEFNYLHFQKRNLKSNIKNLCQCNSFYITPNGFISKGESKITKKEISVLGHIYPFKDIKSYIHYQLMRLQNKISKIKTKRQERKIADKIIGI